MDKIKQDIIALDNIAIKAQRIGWRTSIVGGYGRPGEAKINLTKGDKVIVISKSNGIIDGSIIHYNSMVQRIHETIKSAIINNVESKEFIWRNFDFKYVKLKSGHKVFFKGDDKQFYEKNVEIFKLLSNLCRTIAIQCGSFFDSMRFTEDDFKQLGEIPIKILEVING